MLGQVKKNVHVPWVVICCQEFNFHSLHPFYRILQCFMEMIKHPRQDKSGQLQLEITLKHSPPQFIFLKRLQRYTLTNNCMCNNTEMIIWSYCIYIYLLLNYDKGNLTKFYHSCCSALHANTVYISHKKQTPEPVFCLLSCQIVSSLTDLGLICD